MPTTPSVLLLTARRTPGRFRAMPVSLAGHGLAIGAVFLFAARPVAVEMPEQTTPRGPLRMLVVAQVKSSAPPPVRPAVLHRNSTPVSPADPAPPRPGPRPDLIGTNAGLPAEEAQSPCLRSCDGADELGRGDGGFFVTPLAGPPENAAGERVAPVPVGGDIRPPTRIRNVSPVYPELARHARIQGVVVVRCVIDSSGQVAQVEVLSGPALLAEAAAGAVRQWLYRPTLLNGIPVAVEMEVRLQFSLR
jgi:periplasmic protein TonB